MTISQINPPGSAGFPLPDDGMQIVHVNPTDRSALLHAVSRLVTVSRRLDEGAAMHFLDYADRNRIRLDHLYAAVEADGTILATALAVPNPGRTAMVFATRMGRERGIARGRLDATGRVIDRACESVAAGGARLAQALLEPRERRERQIFERVEFEPIATLSYLQRTAVRRLRSSEEIDWPSNTTLETYRDDNREAFLNVLEESYEGTLDCPALCGLRSTSDILEGHRATGLFDAALWTLLRIDSRPVGILLMNPAADRQSIELVYLGVAAHARGGGLGERLVKHGIAIAASRPERTITLAVDEKNAPALRIYFRAGFRRLLRRVALIRILE